MAEKLVKSPTTRTRRAPFEGGGNRLRVTGKDPNYEYRIVNITEDRIEDLREYGYEIDTDESVRVGGSRVDDNSALGRVREISVGAGAKAVLMRKRKDWFDEDQEAKQERVKQLEAAMRPDPNEGQTGSVQLTRKI